MCTTTNRYKQQIVENFFQPQGKSPIFCVNTHTHTTPDIRACNIHFLLYPDVDSPQKKFCISSCFFSQGQGRERGASGLPRRSCLTARNDDVPFSFRISRHCITFSRHCEVRSNPENHNNQINQINHSSKK